MKILLKTWLIATTFLFFLQNQPIIAQPENDECINAIDISYAFMGSCGDVTLNGPYDLTGSTPSENDPPEPSVFACPGEHPEDTNLFADNAEEWENSVWFKWTVPDLNGDGSDIAYSIWTSDGSFGDDCGINPNNILAGDTDTQVAIYQETECPTASFSPCGHYAANEDLFDIPPWISGWLVLPFTPGETYYMGIDGWDGVQGEICLTVVVCGVECGDDICAPVEDYCTCITDCSDACPATNIYGINETVSGNFRSPDWSGNVLHCSERVFGYDNGNLYLTLGGSDENCTEERLDLPVELSIGSLVIGDGNGTDTLTAGFYTFIELTPAEMAIGEITITATQPDGIGNICTTFRTVDLTALEVSCNITCFAGGIDTTLLNNGITVCEGKPFTISTDGMEDLTLPCNSYFDSSYLYYWRVLIDFYGTDEYSPATSWQPLGTNPTINPDTFFIDEFGYLPPNFAAGNPISFFDPYDEPWSIRIQGAALCFIGGTIEGGCLAANDDYETSEIEVLYLPADDPFCLENMGSNGTLPAVGSFDCEE